jgi:hypothetical protein
MTVYLSITAWTAQAILVSAGTTAVTGGIAALIDTICEAIPDTC